MNYLLNKRDAETLREVTRSVLGNLGGGRANYHRETHKKSLPAAATAFNWQIKCNYIADGENAGKGYVVIDDNAPCIVKISFAKWQPVSISDKTRYFLMLTGENFTRGQVAGVLQRPVQLPCVVYITTQDSVYEFSHVLVEVAEGMELLPSRRGGAVYGDFGQRPSSGTARGDRAVIATIDAAGNVSQLERGIPHLVMIKDDNLPDGMEELESDDRLLPLI